MGNPMGYALLITLVSQVRALLCKVLDTTEDRGYYSAHGLDPPG
jgi:hypothetical protein